MVERSNIANLDGLVALGRDGIDIQPTLLRVSTDLYIQKPTHSAEEERHYTELALRLIDLVDAQTRSIVAERLVSYPAAPHAILQRLARDTVGPDTRPAFVAMAEPAPAVVAVIAKPPVAASVPAAELSELFLSAPADERRLILLHLDLAPEPSFAPIAAQAAQDSIRRIETAALAHNGEMLVQEVERVLAISRSLARRLIDDPDGEPIVVIAKALNMPAAVLQRILLCLNPNISQSIQRVYELATLYEEITPEATARLVGIWRAANPAAPRAAGHRTHYANEDIKSRAQPATRPAIRWEEYGQPAKAERS